MIVTESIIVVSVTNQVKVSNFHEGREWYIKLLGRGPDFMELRGGYTT